MNIYKILIFGNRK